MTKREMKVYKKMEKDLQMGGFLTKKKRLNRKKFVEEAREELNNINYETIMNLIVSLHVTMCRKDSNLNISDEAVGAAKAVKIAVRLTEIEKKVKERGDTKCEAEERFEYIKDIFEA